MDINIHQVVAMTYEEKVAAYQKLTKKELIKMLIEVNRLIPLMYGQPNYHITKSTPLREECTHQWVLLPSITTGVFRYQCFKCGKITQSDGSDCITTNTY